MEIIIKIDENKEEGVNGKREKGCNVSQYARFFNSNCPAWSKETEYNLLYLKQQEMYATAMLRAKGYLFLNDVYDMLGIPRSREGQAVGWIYNEENPIGDNRVDFGLYENHNQHFINGYERDVLLDFNVDGCILDKI